MKIITDFSMGQNFMQSMVIKLLPVPKPMKTVLQFLPLISLNNYHQLAPNINIYMLLQSCYQPASNNMSI